MGSWTQNWYGTSNAQVMVNLNDPFGNFAFEIHAYFDSDHSGTKPTCTESASSLLHDVTSWARQHGKRLFLGEFAGANNDACRKIVNDALSWMQSNEDVFMGWTWWAAGPWWGNYMYSIEPANGQDQPQVEWLKPYLHG